MSYTIRTALTTGAHPCFERKDSKAAASHGFTCPTDLLRRVSHHGVRAELALFDVDDPSCLGGCDYEVRLSTEEGWDLDDVGHLCHGRCLADFVQVRDDGQPVCLLHLL